MSCCGSCGGEDVNQAKEQDKEQINDESQIQDKEVNKTDEQE
ncbi:MAG: hypothetical protein OQK58_13745 [Gammaproteobacteria bacterium]|nr:hypothetical protein [Gammaproteobacteria bacterium]